MTENWADTDNYLSDTLIGEDATLDAAIAANAQAQLPPIDVAPVQGKFLHLLARAIGAQRVLEVGTLGGYSTIWLARAVGEDGRVVTLEYEPHHAEVARVNIDRALVGDRVEIKVGAALDTLPTLSADQPFDLVFIDADKPNNANYVQAALRLSRPGTVIVVDNIVRQGTLADATQNDDSVRGARDVLELFATDPQFDATALQTIGVKGWDGFALALVQDPR